MIVAFLLTSVYRQLFSCVDHATATVMANLGVGKHIFEVDPANLPMLHTLNRVGVTFAISACVWTKTSWALTMLRIVRATQDYMRVIVWCLLVSVNILMDVGLILNFMKCDDEPGLTMSPNEMWCWTNLTAANYNVFSAAWSGLADIVLALLAWVIILPMQMRSNEKIGVAVAMSLGLVSGAMALAKTANVLLMAKMDFTYEVTNLIIWTAAEISSLIMAASVPFIRLFVKNKLSTPKSYSSGAQRLNEQPQDKSTTPSVPTTVGSSRRGWRAHSGDSDLLADSLPEMAEHNSSLGPYP
ncbi:hypothetical protein N8I77_013213 [Diaporthe amygdali]|uniref:Rhodopsin domain-containing protein n=1 Tax=Phomopsis amygdali TaxID=1214568 RepID=A0AAD9VWT7_PHOAM|nr:hypothetical protein N8I77_013213 [Diaporthe amygdali]